MTTETTIDGTATEMPSPAAPRRSRRGWIVGAIAAPLAFGAVGLSLAQNSGVTLTPVAPVTIAQLTPSGAIAAKGDVAEIFGNKFILQDGSGRALVETGKQGEGGTLVTKGEAVTVQGRFENGFLHATLLTRADGKTVVLGPARGPKPGGLDWAKDKVGLGPEIDAPALTAKVEAAGYSDIRVTGSGPRHLDMAAKGQDGRERLLHVGFDGDIREKRSF
ncbi:hypothetical protein MBUL_00679 [Methylobacterium bullatum]|uniref:DNA-binding protein n=1 Tax=Methylobacterium bullatum TaxID=570505 RepID=A0A679IKC2_9HYPH|nr:hypothetical protein MBUL_00679 [Methylobacterium bullatum]